MPQFVCVKDFEKHALQVLNPKVRDFYKSGADDENTLKWNKEVFTKYVEKIDSQLYFFSKKWKKKIRISNYFLKKRHIFSLINSNLINEWRLNLGVNWFAI